MKIKWYVIVAIIIGVSIGRYYTQEVQFERRKAEMIERLKEHASEIAEKNYSSFIITEKEDK